MALPWCMLKITLTLGGTGVLLCNAQRIARFSPPGIWRYADKTSELIRVGNVNALIAFLTNFAFYAVNQKARCAHWKFS